MKTVRNEEGFVLVAGMMILLILTLLGISATTNTSIELKIAGNDRIHKETFYAAEAGALLGSEVLEQNFNCDTGFARTATIAGKDYADLEGSIKVWEWDTNNDLALWRNADPSNDPGGNRITDADTLNKADIIYQANPPDPANRLAAIDPDGDGDFSDNPEETGYIYVGGFTEMLPGGNIVQAAGYEGPGKGGAKGGVAKIIDIYSRYQGVLNSEAIILYGWRHVIGSEGSCNYGP